VWVHGCSQIAKAEVARGCAEAVWIFLLPLPGLPETLCRESKTGPTRKPIRSRASQCHRA